MAKKFKKETKEIDGDKNGNGNLLSQPSFLFFDRKKEIPRSKKRKGIRKYPIPKSFASAS